MYRRKWSAVGQRIQNNKCPVTGLNNLMYPEWSVVYSVWYSDVSSMPQGENEYVCEVLYVAICSIEIILMVNIYFETLFCILYIYAIKFTFDRMMKRLELLSKFIYTISIRVRIWALLTYSSNSISFRHWLCKRYLLFFFIFLERQKECEGGKEEKVCIPPMAAT